MARVGVACAYLHGLRWKCSHSNRDVRGVDRAIAELTLAVVAPAPHGAVVLAGADAVATHRDLGGALGDRVDAGDLSASLPAPY